MAERPKETEAAWLSMLVRSRAVRDSLTGSATIARSNSAKLTGQYIPEWVTVKSAESFRGQVWFVTLPRLPCNTTILGEATEGASCISPRILGLLAHPCW